MKKFYQTDKEANDMKYQAEYNHLKNLNQKLVAENEDLKKQVYETEVRSKDSIGRYSSLENDYEKLRGELDLQIKKNDETNKDLWRNIDQRKKLEGELKALESDLDLYKANLNDQGAQSLREISLLKT